MSIEIAIIIILAAVMLYELQSFGNNKGHHASFVYKKRCLMTDCEKRYFAAIKNSVNSSYIVQPQINLATIIEKRGEYKYYSELFRNIDFGIFDRFYNIILLIEINDKSHNKANRRERDEKVKRIVDAAGIPLITFYTKDGLNQEDISKKIAGVLQEKYY